MRDSILPVPDVELKADCARCTGLCCVAPAFDADQGFGFDKPAHEPCRHLRTDDGCAIHAQLAVRGFPGCVQFDCHGAGQRIAQQFFPGQHWRDSDATSRAMFDAYSRLLPLHELMAMLAWAVPKVATGTAREEIQRQSRRISDAGPDIVAGRGALTTQALREETLALLRAQLPRAGARDVRS
ncbi:MAG: hypothetical protein RL030_500 [Pseudomonadota bacterium]|jgi:hypothetical protein